MYYQGYEEKKAYSWLEEDEDYDDEVAKTSINPGTILKLADSNSMEEKKAKDIAKSSSRQESANIKASEVQGIELSPEISEKIISQIGKGELLHYIVKIKYEVEFGKLFYNVRVHDDEISYELNDILGSKAFTVGSDIFFAKDQYQPETEEGRELIKHELAHVIQQDGKTPFVQTKKIEKEVPSNTKKTKYEKNLEKLITDINAVQSETGVFTNFRGASREWRENTQNKLKEKGSYTFNQVSDFYKLFQGAFNYEMNQNAKKLVEGYAKVAESEETAANNKKDYIKNMAIDLLLAYHNTEAVKKGKAYSASQFKAILDQNPFLASKYPVILDQRYWVKIVRFLSGNYQYNRFFLHGLRELEGFIDDAFKQREEDLNEAIDLLSGNKVYFWDYPKEKNLIFQLTQKKWKIEENSGVDYLIDFHFKLADYSRTLFEALEITLAAISTVLSFGTSEAMLIAGRMLASSFSLIGGG